jgi:hypothetical protein
MCEDIVVNHGTPPNQALQPTAGGCVISPSLMKQLSTLASSLSPAITELVLVRPTM